MEDRTTQLESELARLKAHKVAIENQDEDAKSMDTTSVQGEDDDEDIVKLPGKLLRKFEEQEWKEFQANSGHEGRKYVEDYGITVLKGDTRIGKNQRVPIELMLPGVKGIAPGTFAEAAENIAVEELYTVLHRIRSAIGPFSYC